MNGNRNYKCYKTVPLSGGRVCIVAIRSTFRFGRPAKTHRRIGWVTPQAVIMKRANLIKQACLMVMRTKHPKEYNEIVQSTAAMLPDGAIPRLAKGVE